MTLKLSKIEIDDFKSFEVAFNSIEPPIFNLKTLKLSKIEIDDFKSFEVGLKI